MKTTTWFHCILCTVTLVLPSAALADFRPLATKVWDFGVEVPIQVELERAGLSGISCAEGLSELARRSAWSIPDITDALPWVGYAINLSGTYQPTPDSPSIDIGFKVSVSLASSWGELAVDMARHIAVQSRLGVNEYREVAGILAVVENRVVYGVYTSNHPDIITGNGTAMKAVLRVMLEDEEPFRRALASEQGILIHRFHSHRPGTPVPSPDDVTTERTTFHALLQKYGPGVHFASHIVPVEYDGELLSTFRPDEPQSVY